MPAIHQVDGGRQFRASLRKAGDDLTDLKGVHAKVANIAAGGARLNVPVRTGRLAGTIRAAGTKTAGIVRVGNNSRVKYAGPVHWGWRARNITPNPFAATGARQTEPRWLAEYETYIDTVIGQVKGI